MTAPCTHARQSPRRYGHTVDGKLGARYTTTVAGERLERSWTTCLDCGVRLERAAVEERGT